MKTKEDSRPEMQKQVQIISDKDEIKILMKQPSAEKIRPTLKRPNSLFLDLQNEVESENSSAGEVSDSVEPK